MARNIFISILGTGYYSETNYYLASKENVVKTNFIQDASLELRAKSWGVMQEGDGVYFDITHAFRSIPMLVMVLINYAKFLKNIEVKSITYGNWESKDSENYSPIIELIAFSNLQDWTSAANEFINFSDVDRLSQLTKNDLLPLLREFQGRDKPIEEIKKLNNNLPVFVDNIITCRGKEIFKNEAGLRIIENLNSISKVVIKPLEPILFKLKDKIKAFNNTKNHFNGLHATKWCIDNHMYQQGYTILEETMINLVCDEIQIDFNDRDNRMIVSSCFKVIKGKIEKSHWTGILKEKSGLAQIIITKSKLVYLISDEFAEVVGIRNDINHAGFSNRDTKANKIKTNLAKIYQKVINKIENQ